MQNIEQKLKELKNIHPDEGYTRRSRSLLVATQITQKPLSPWRILVTSIQFGSTIALTTVLLIVIILGGVSVWKIISPLRLSSLDPASLKAEAKAIDIQIELANLTYREITEKAAEEIAPKTTSPAAPTLPSAPETENVSSTEEKISADEALDILAK